MWWTKLTEIDPDKYILAKYLVSADTLENAAWAIAVGQSIGNPYIRNSWESSDLIKTHGCVILDNKDELSKLNTGTITIGFPIVNFNFEEDGINHLLCQLMGGHTDINEIYSCRLIELKFPDELLNKFKKPKFGITGIRDYLGQYNKPIAGSIVKPKIGFTKQQYSDIISILIDAGIDFIKEDEIISNPTYFSLRDRVEIVSNLLAKKNHKMIFCHTINSDPHNLLEKVKTVHESGGNGVHLNVLGGMGIYNSVRQLDLPIFMHFQSSGVKLISDIGNKYSISLQVICQLASLIGVDTFQVGMIGGYSNDDESVVLESIDELRSNNTLPALSCGLHPGLIEPLNNKLGVDYLANSGGAIHGHPEGSYVGAKQLRTTIDEGV
jgi:ribulose-bisphosphate carboxylase large chain